MQLIVRFPAEREAIVLGFETAANVGDVVVSEEQFFLHLLRAEVDPVTAVGADEPIQFGSRRGGEWDPAHVAATRDGDTEDAGRLRRVHGGDRPSFGSMVGTEEGAVEVGGDQPDLHGTSLAANVR